MFRLPFVLAACCGATRLGLRHDPFRQRLATVPRGGFIDESFGSLQKNALIGGYAALAVASTPYVLGLICPKLIENFFLPIYKPGEKARIAEIYWKLMYATFGFGFVTLCVVEVFFTEKGATKILRDSFLAWAAFYTAAIVKIRYEARVLDILEGDRFFIQTFHLIVVLAMWASVYLSY